MSIPQPAHPVDIAVPAIDAGMIGASQTPEAQQQPSTSVPYTPEQILELEQYAIAATRRLEELKPYEEDIKRLKDPEIKEFWNNAVSYYENGKKAAVPAQPTAYDDQAIKEVLSYVRERKQQEVAQQEAEYNRWLAEQRMAELKMRRDYGLTDDQIATLAEVADAENRRTGRRVGFQEAYTRVATGFQRAGSTPPTVGLRGDASLPGVPGPSSVSNDAYLKDFRGSLIASLSAGQAQRA